MPNLNLKTLFIIAAVTALVALIFIIVIAVNRERIKYVSSSSKKLKAIEQLNGRILFISIDAEKRVPFYCKSRAQFELTDLDEILMKDVKNTPRVYGMLLDDIHDNQKKYAEYRQEYNSIMNTDSEEEMEIYRKHSYYRTLEQTMCEEIEMHPVTELVVRVYKNYTTPKGRNHYSRECCFYEANVIEGLQKAKNAEEFKKTASYERSKMSNSLRYDVMKRDGFKCTICGASPEFDDVRLEVDHIKPISKGGTTEMYNLRTLCNRCNSGKRAKYDPVGDN